MTISVCKLSCTIRFFQITSPVCQSALITVQLAVLLVALFVAPYYGYFAGGYCILCTPKWHVIMCWMCQCNCIHTQGKDITPTVIEAPQNCPLKFHINNGNTVVLCKYCTVVKFTVCGLMTLSHTYMFLPPHAFSVCLSLLRTMKEEEEMGTEEPLVPGAWAKVCQGNRRKAWTWWNTSCWA